MRHRQIDWLIALQDVCCVEAHLTIRLRQAGPVAHQAAGFGVRARVIDRGQGMARRQAGKLDRRLRVTPVVFIVDDDVSVRESLEFAG